MILSVFITMFIYLEAMHQVRSLRHTGWGGGSRLLPASQARLLPPWQMVRAQPCVQKSRPLQVAGWSPPGLSAVSEGTQENGGGHASPSHPWASEFADCLLLLLDTSGQR